ncbi:MAG: hypothetical protein DF280_03135 ['Brassica napus' phytoplasma]|nr:MAG: hypothetical protein DF280_03135 ['Brassica napus' phytoplasma]
MTNSNFTIDFVSGKLFVVGLCFIFKYLFFSFLRLFNPNDNNPIKKKMKPQTQIIKKKRFKKKISIKKIPNKQEYNENITLETLINQENYQNYQ